MLIVKNNECPKCGGVKEGWNADDFAGHWWYDCEENPIG